METDFIYISEFEIGLCIRDEETWTDTIMTLLFQQSFKKKKSFISDKIPGLKLTQTMIYSQYSKYNYCNKGPWGNSISVLINI